MRKGTEACERGGTHQRGGERPDTATAHSGNYLHLQRRTQYLPVILTHTQNVIYIEFFSVKLITAVLLFPILIFFALLGVSWLP